MGLDDRYGISHLEITIPVCKVCKNLINEDGICKVYGDRPKEYMYAKKYDCPHRDIDEKINGMIK